MRIKIKKTININKIVKKIKRVSLILRFGIWNRDWCVCSCIVGEKCTRKISQIALIIEKFYDKLYW